MRDNINRFIIRWVESNLTSGSPISELEGLTGYSGKTLQRWFSESSGMTPGEYLSRRRMSRAAVLLRMTALPVTEIADMFHYYSSQNFSRAFLRFTGLTPTEYRDHSEWFCLYLQPSLLIDKSRFSDNAVCQLPDRYLLGHEINSIDYVVSTSMEGKVLSFIQRSVEGCRSEGQKEIYMAAIAHKPSEVSIGRKDAIDVFFHIGQLVEPGQNHTLYLPAGDYIRWRFAGSWEEYVVLSKSACMMLTSGTTIRRRVGYDYIHFIPATATMTDGEITCDMYIPVAIHDD